MIKKIQNRLITLSNLTKEFLVLILLSVLIFVIMGYFDHTENQLALATFMIVFSILKVYVFISKTLKKMDILTRNKHKMKHILLFFIVIIFFINISFTLDYLCVSEIYKDSFAGLNLNQPLFFKFFDILYFSIVTFTTVGYGDIFPFGKTVKILTILEMATAFITIVFIISRYTRYERNEKE